MSAAQALFDAPGPKARRRHRALTVLGALIAAALAWLVIRKFNDRGQFDASLWKPFLTVDVWRYYILKGLIGTFQAAAVSITLAMAFGLVFGMGRLSANRPVRWVSSVVVEFFRAVPVLIMMIFAFAMYAQNNVFSSTLNPFMAVVTALTLYNGAVIAELVRSGVHGLPKGQNEAGLSIGLTSAQTMRSVLLPQALRAMLPALVGQCVVVLKDSALGYVITYNELLIWSKTLGSAKANTVAAYLVAALLFILINFALTWLAVRLERRLSRKGRSTLPANPTAAMPMPGGTGAPAEPVALTAPAHDRPGAL